MAKNFRDTRRGSTETVHMGTYIHPAESMLVLKLEHKDIPYPNSPVLQNGKQIGKVDEIFGAIDNVFVSVNLDNGCKVSDFKPEAKLEGYRDKFMFKNRFLPREEVEKKKEKDDRVRAEGDKKFGGKKFGDRKFGDKKFGDKKFGDRKFGDRKFGDRKFGERKQQGDFRGGNKNGEQKGGRPNNGKRDFRKRDE